MTYTLVDADGIPVPTAGLKIGKRDLEVCKECCVDFYCWKLCHAKWQGIDCPRCAKAKFQDEWRRNRFSAKRKPTGDKSLDATGTLV